MRKQDNTAGIFSKYATGYQEKYTDVSLYMHYLDFFLENLKKEQAEVLELGCGPGNLTGYLLEKRSDLNILGIDIAENMLRLAKINHPSVEFRKMDARNITELNKKFDAVVCGFCLPYLSKEGAERLIRDISNILNTNGILYLSTIHGDYKNSGYKFSENAPRDKLYTYLHERAYLEKFLQDANLDILKMELIDNPDNEPGEEDLVIIAQLIS